MRGECTFSKSSEVGKRGTVDDKSTKRKQESDGGKEEKKLDARMHLILLFLVLLGRLG